MNRYIDPRSKLLQHLDRLASLKAGNYAAPVNVEIDLSNRCSLGCQWCHFGFTHTRGPLAGKRAKPEFAVPGGDLMDFDLSKTIINDLANNGVRSVTWTGGGEPTLHPQFDDVILHTAHTALEQGMYTHGGHINLDRADLLKRLMTWVYVSLDCSDRESYADEKGVDRFEAACQGIRNLAFANGGATIGVGFLIHKDNYHRLHDMLALALGLGADYAQFRPAIYFDVKNPGKPSEDTTWVDAVLPDLERLAVLDRVVVDVDRFRMYRNWRGHGYTTCYWAAMQTIITPDGSMWTCGNKREHAGGWLGNLKSDSFETIWKESGGPKEVDEHCRVLCRGHVPNVALQEIMREQAHKNFI